MSTTRSTKSSSRFFTVATLVAAFVAFGGFSISYFAPIAQGRFEAPLSVHIHAAIFFSWIVLAVVQAVLVALKHVRAHRSLGLATIVLVPLMIVSGAYVALSSAARRANAGNVEGAESFLIVPLTDLLLFGTLVTLGMRARRRPQTHKRLMLLATSALLPPAFARAFIPFHVDATWVSTLAADVFLLAGGLDDFEREGRVHPAYVAGGGLVVGLHVMRELSGGSELWRSIARRLLGL